MITTITQYERLVECFTLVKKPAVTWASQSDKVQKLQSCNVTNDPGLE